ncbi:MAG: tetratricopeptide repeat protein, partial [Anaerolineae bacterium]|nr:tetratricopeptide repeat protein [Anaerolineae bacterium]
MKSRFRITLLALAGLLSLGTCAFLRSTGSVYVNLGSIELSKAKSQPGDHLTQAGSYLERSVELAPTDARGWFGLGKVAQAQAEFHQAVGFFSQALDLEPGNGLLHFLLGNVHSALGRRSEAVSHWLQTGRAQAIALNLYRSASKAVRDGQDKPAEALLLDAVALDPTSTDGYLALGNLYVKTDVARAIWAFERAAKIELGSPVQISYAEGRAYVLKEEWASAVAALQQTVSLDPGYAAAYYPLGYALYRRGESALAEEALQEALVLTPEHFYAHLLLGRVYLEQGEVAEAFSLLHRACALSPEDAEARAWLGRAYREQGRLEEATAELRKATELEPDNPEWHLQLARVHRDNGQWNLALGEYELVLELDPTNSRAESEIAALRRH